MLSSACEARIWPIGDASGGQPDLGADAHDLGERVEQAIAGGVRAQMDVERGHEAGREVVLGGADGDARRDGRDRLVADVLVDEVAGLPQRCGVDAGLAPETVERVDERLAGDAVERQRQRVDRCRDRGRRRRRVATTALSRPVPAAP